MPSIFPASDEHIRCLKCLEKGHSPSGCSNCWTCTPRVCKDRQNRLQMLMLKEALSVKLSDSGGSLALKTERPVFAPVASSSKAKLSEVSKLLGSLSALVPDHLFKTLKKLVEKANCVLRNIEPF